MSETPGMTVEVMSAPTTVIVGAEQIEVTLAPQAVQVATIGILGPPGPPGGTVIGGADVAVVDLLENDVLRFDGTNWVNVRQEVLVDGGNF